MRVNNNENEKLNSVYSLNGKNCAKVNQCKEDVSFGNHEDSFELQNEDKKQKKEVLKEVSLYLGSIGMLALSAISCGIMCTLSRGKINGALFNVDINDVNENRVKKFLAKIGDKFLTKKQAEDIKQIKILEKQFNNFTKQLNDNKLTGNNIELIAKNISSQISKDKEFFNEALNVLTDKNAKQYALLSDEIDAQFISNVESKEASLKEMLKSAKSQREKNALTKGIEFLEKIKTPENFRKLVANLESVDLEKNWYEFNVEDIEKELKGSKNTIDDILSKEESDEVYKSIEKPIGNISDEKNITNELEGSNELGVEIKEPSVEEINIRLKNIFEKKVKDCSEKDSLENNCLTYLANNLENKNFITAYQQLKDGNLQLAEAYFELGKTYDNNKKSLLTNAIYYLEHKNEKIDKNFIDDLVFFAKNIPENLKKEDFEQYKKMAYTKNNEAKENFKKFMIEEDTEKKEVLKMRSFAIQDNNNSTKYLCDMYLNGIPMQKQMCLNALKSENPTLINIASEAIKDYRDNSSGKYETLYKEVLDVFKKEYPSKSSIEYKKQIMKKYDELFNIIKNNSGSINYQEVMIRNQLRVIQYKAFYDAMLENLTVIKEKYTTEISEDASRKLSRLINQIEIIMENSDSVLNMYDNQLKEKDVEKYKEIFSKIEIGKSDKYPIFQYDLAGELNKSRTISDENLMKIEELKELTDINDINRMLTKVLNVNKAYNLKLNLYQKLIDSNNENAKIYFAKAIINMDNNGEEELTDFYKKIALLIEDGISVSNVKEIENTYNLDKDKAFALIKMYKSQYPDIYKEEVIDNWKGTLNKYHENRAKIRMKQQNAINENNQKAQIYYKNALNNIENKEIAQLYEKAGDNQISDNVEIANYYGKWAEKRNEVISQFNIKPNSDNEKLNQLNKYQKDIDRKYEHLILCVKYKNNPNCSENLKKIAQDFELLINENGAPENSEMLKEFFTKIYTLETKQRQIEEYKKEPNYNRARLNKMELELSKYINNIYIQNKDYIDANGNIKFQCEKIEKGVKEKIELDDVKYKLPNRPSNN